MTLGSILAFAALALLFRLVARERYRGELLLISSVLAIYWLQPLSPVRNWISGCLPAPWRWPC